MATKTLLDPLVKQVPRRGLAKPKRLMKSYVYQDENSRYFMGAFPPINIPPDSTDKFYVLEAADVGRPDVLSYKMYKTPELYWVILWMNNINDPFEGMYPGMLLRVPTMARLSAFGIYV